MVCEKHLRNGEEIYVIRRENGWAVDCSGYMLIAVTNGAAIVSSYINDLETLGDTVQYCIDQTAEGLETELEVYPLDDCFENREDAERRLAQEQQDIGEDA